MSIAFSQAKLQAEERRAILQAIESQIQQVIIDGVARCCKSFWSRKSPSSLDGPRAVHGG
jgi:hypothetical protein